MCAEVSKQAIKIKTALYFNIKCVPSSAPSWPTHPCQRPISHPRVAPAPHVPLAAIPLGRASGAGRNSATMAAARSNAVGPCRSELAAQVCTGPVQWQVGTGPFALGHCYS